MNTHKLRSAGLALVICCLGFSAQSFASNTSIQMLPPTDYDGQTCTATTGGILQWDGSTPIKCVPGARGDGDGNLATNGNLVTNGTIKPGSSGVVAGAACVTEGAMGYDDTSTVHQPLYCNSSLVWAAPPASQEIGLPVGELNQYHHACTNPFTDFMPCSAACS